MSAPYEIVGELKRFDRKYTAFRRSRWDPTCRAYGTEHKSVEDVVASGRDGYTREDFALQAGAWAMSRASHRTEDATDRERDDMESAEPTEAARPEVTDPAACTEGVKRAAKLYGADLVGVTHVNPLWIYAEDSELPPEPLPEDVTTAVVCVVEMDYDLIKTSPSVQAAAATGQGYSRMAFVTRCLSRYLRHLGWQAVPSGNDTALSIPLAIDAGLGELARNGLLITEAFGPRVRLCKVFTDAPLVPDAPRTLGVRETCETCVRCVDACDADAISPDVPTHRGPTPSNNPGVLKWYINPEKCLAFWRKNGCSCSNCIAACPFNAAPGKQVRPQSLPE